MKELREGKITLEELADWFGITAGSIRKKNSKEKRLKMLESFAAYHFEGRSIYIDKVYISTFSKAYEIVKKRFLEEWHKNGIDTCSRVGEAIYAKSKEVQSQISKETTKKYTNTVKIEFYGHNHGKDMGELGYSTYCWCVFKVGGCEELPPRDLEIIGNLAKKIYGEAYGERAALLGEAFCKGEITSYEFDMGVSLSKEEIQECRDQLKLAIEQALGYYPDQATKLINAVSFE